jgi:hypothetical protein
VRRDRILTLIRYERRRTRLLEQDGAIASGGVRQGRCMGSVNRRGALPDCWLRTTGNYGYSLDLNTALHREVCFTVLAMCM